MYKNKKNHNEKHEYSVYWRVLFLSEDLEREDLKLAYAKNNIIADKKRRNFLSIFK